MGEILALIVEPEKAPYTKIILDELQTLQDIVGGNIEVVYPFEDLVGLIVNEEGKLLDLPLNRALRDEDGNIYDIIAGTIIVVGLGEGDFTSLTPELVEKYTKFFSDPKTVVRSIHLEK
jgi:hypothetical protein